MSKCSQCRKNDALDTGWEKTRWWLFHRMFPKDITDLSQDKFTQGFSDGYVKGHSHAKEEDIKYFNMMINHPETTEIVKMVWEGTTASPHKVKTIEELLTLMGDDNVCIWRYGGVWHAGRSISAPIDTQEGLTALEALTKLYTKLYGKN